MDTVQRESWSRTVRRHRSIYRFGGAWAQSILASVPWVNTVVIMVLLLSVNQRMVVSPGVMFDLPRAPLREGMHAGLTALMISVARDTPGGDEALVFFDDDRFVAQDPEQLAMFRDRIKSRLALGSRRELLLLADKRVRHGDVVLLVNAVREAGVQRVNVAEKPE